MFDTRRNGRGYQQQQQQQQQQQASSRYAPLPEIGRNSGVTSRSLDNSLSQQQQQQQLVPVGNDSLIRSLESRVSATEQSGVSLLTEVSRLRAQLDVASQQAESALHQERQARQQLEETLRAGSQLTTQLEQRMAAHELRLRQERDAVSDAVGQAKNLERRLATSQSAVVDESRVVGLEREVEEMRRAKQQLERVAFQLVEELRAVKQRLESQGVDFNVTASELKVVSKRLQDDYGQQLDTVQRKLHMADQVGQYSSQQLRSHLETKVAEMREQLAQLKSRAEVDLQERRSLEQQAAQRMAKLTDALADQSRRQDEALHSLEQRHRDQHRQLESERASLLARLTEAIEQANQRLHQQEIRLRDEALKRQEELERHLLRQQEARAASDHENKQEQQQRWEAQSRQQQEQFDSIKAEQRSGKKRLAETLRKLEESLELVEKQLEQSRKEASQVIGAEVASRKAKDRETKTGLLRLEEKIAAATDSLQKEMAAVANQIRVENERTKRRIGEALEQQKREMEKSLSEVDAQVQTLRVRIATIDERLEAKVKSATSGLSDSLSEQMRSIAAWQAEADRTLAELSGELKAADGGVSANSEVIDSLRQELRSAVGREILGRVQDIDSLREELQNRGGDSGISKAELEECQASIRRLAEISQTVKSVMTAKIQAERQERQESLEPVKEEVKQLKDTIEWLAERLLEPKMFVKPDAWQLKGRTIAEEGANEVNKWSVYSAYRWLYFKLRLLQLKEKSVGGKE